MTEVRHASTAEDVAAARELFLEYAASLNIDLCFQGFDHEVATLPGKYAEPEGALLIAWDGSTPIGCVALRALETPAAAELKRLYFRPEARGRGIWKRMLLDIFDRARAADLLGFVGLAGFEDRRADDWMSRHFFAGGMMPSDDMPLQFQQHLVLQQRWRWSGAGRRRCSRPSSRPS